MSKKKDSSIKQFLEKKGIPCIVKAGLCHGNKIVEVSIKDKGKIIKETDGLTTKDKGVFLAITVCDCLPVLFYNPKEKKIGIVHAGWKGIYSGIIENIETDFKTAFFYIGPGISKCHYEVKKDFPLPFFKKNGKYFSDLKKIVKEKLISLKAKEQNIEISSDCTYCLKNKYFSFRRDKKVNPMLVVFGVVD